MTTQRPAAGSRTQELLAVVFAAILLVTACGDDDGSSDAVDDASTEDAADEPTTDGDPTPASESEDTPAGGAGEFCADLEAYTLDAIALTSSFFTADAGAIRAAAAPLRGETDAVEASAPGALAADVVLVNDNYLRVIDTLEASDYDLESLSTIGADPPEVTAAWGRINDYAVTECGFDPVAMATDARPGR